MGFRLRGNDVVVRGNDGGSGHPLLSLRWPPLGALFTLTLALSHRGRGDVSPGTGPLGSRLRGNDGQVRGNDGVVLEGDFGFGFDFVGVDFVAEAGLVGDC